MPLPVDAQCGSNVAPAFAGHEDAPADAARPGVGNGADYIGKIDAPKGTSGMRISGEFKAVVKAAAIAAATFVGLGTVAALWQNPLFIRMTPAGAAEIALLAVQSVLLGVYFSMPRRACAGRQAGVGSVLAFLGIACPVCNKMLLFVFGSELLLVYFEPVRIHVVAAGIMVTAAAVWIRWRRVRSPNCRGKERDRGLPGASATLPPAPIVDTPAPARTLFTFYGRATCARMTIPGRTDGKAPRTRRRATNL